jgi:uncharacterized repeat protein (TIGR03803 family)
MRENRHYHPRVLPRGPVYGARATLASAIMLASVLVPPQVAHAQTYSLLYSFQCSGNDGAGPTAGLVRDSAGNLYGTTQVGGTSNQGTVFEVTATGTETVLHSFGGPPKDGAYPGASLVRSPQGRLYGTTQNGGTYGFGTVFELGPGGKMTVLYSFADGADGGYPEAGLARDTAGNLYGTTAIGGAYGLGVLFKVSAVGQETVLHSFGEGSDGATPISVPLLDSAGDLFGTTYWGGAFGLGTVFEVDSTGTETVLYSFAGGPGDGAHPPAGLVRDAAGNLYGTTGGGGARELGTIFELSAVGSENLLYSFNGYKGASPDAGLAIDGKGNLYGSTQGGGTAGHDGVLFRLSTADQEYVLHNFAGSPSDGNLPVGGVLLDATGNLYGTTANGGASNCGTVFEYTP